VLSFPRVFGADAPGSRFARNAGCTPVLESGESQPAGSQPRVQTRTSARQLVGSRYPARASHTGRIAALSNPPAPSGTLGSRPQITLVKRGSRVRIPPSASGVMQAFRVAAGLTRRSAQRHSRTQPVHATRESRPRRFGARSDPGPGAPRRDADTCGDRPALDDSRDRRHEHARPGWKQGPGPAQIAPDKQILGAERHSNPDQSPDQRFLEIIAEN
jgi:hypothetical protein